MTTEQFNIKELQEGYYWIKYRGQWIVSELIISKYRHYFDLGDMEADEEHISALNPIKIIRDENTDILF